MNGSKLDAFELEIWPLKFWNICTIAMFPPTHCVSGRGHEHMYVMTFTQVAQYSNIGNLLAVYRLCMQLHYKA